MQRAGDMRGCLDEKGVEVLIRGPGTAARETIRKTRLAGSDCAAERRGVGTMAIQQQTGKGKPTNWRWQPRFIAEGVDSPLREAARPGKPPLVVQRSQLSAPPECVALRRFYRRADLEDRAAHHITPPPASPITNASRNSGAPVLASRVVQTVKSRSSADHQSQS
jgi:hypothetical protein